MSGLDIDALNFEDEWPRSVVAAGDHDPVVLCPAVHNGTALQRGVDIAADGIPRLRVNGTPTLPQYIVPGESSTPSSGAPLFISAPAPICQ